MNNPNEKQSVVLHREQPVERQQGFAGGIDMQALLAKAVNANSAVDVIERLNALRRETMAEEARMSFNRALAEFQAEAPVILKNKAVTSGGQKLYSYTPFSDIIAQVKELMQKHGFSFTLDTDVESKDGWVIAKCRLVHAAGHSETSTGKFPLGGGTKAMSTTQVFAAALTFASRRVFCNALGLVTADEDLDGRTQQPKAAGPSRLAAEPTVKELARELWHTLGNVCAGDKDWRRASQWMVDEAVIADTEYSETAPDFTPARFREVIAKAKAKLQH